MIRTKEELKAKRFRYKITQAQLAEACNLGVNSIANIEQGQRKGKEETWKKINTFFTAIEKEGNIFSKNDDILNQLENDIQKYGEQKECFIIYKFHNYAVIFTGYQYEVTDKEKKNFLIGTLKNAFEIFSMQRDIE